MSGLLALRGWLAAVLLACALASPGLALAQGTPRTSVADIEDEVMCVQCGRPLATSSGSAADQQRQLMQNWIDEGLDKQQVKNRLVAEYGERVLVNDRSPIAAVAPWLAALAGIASITLLLRRRTQRDGEPAATASAAASAAEPAARVSAADDARIDAELAERD